MVQVSAVQYRGWETGSSAGSSAVQVGATPGRITPTKGGRRESVGSAGSAELATVAATEVEKATPKSNKKQVTKTEKKTKVSRQIAFVVKKSDLTSPVAGAKVRKADEEEPETTFSD